MISRIENRAKKIKNIIGK
ncbi:hypothetical protein D030_3259A, partial [Vibrio parahaemolyticus AQ3810]